MQKVRPQWSITKYFPLKFKGCYLFLQTEPSHLQKVIINTGWISDIWKKIQANILREPLVISAVQWFSQNNSLNLFPDIAITNYTLYNTQINILSKISISKQYLILMPIFHVYFNSPII